MGFALKCQCFYLKRRHVYTLLPTISPLILLNELCLVPHWPKSDFEHTMVNIVCSINTSCKGRIFKPDFGYLPIGTWILSLFFFGHSYVLSEIYYMFLIKTHQKRSPKKLRKSQPGAQNFFKTSRVPISRYLHNQMFPNKKFWESVRRTEYIGKIVHVSQKIWNTRKRSVLPWRA